MDDLKNQKAKQILASYVDTTQFRPMPLVMHITLSKTIADSPAYSTDILKLAALEEWKDTLLNNMEITSTYNSEDDKVDYSVTLLLGKEE